MRNTARVKLNEAVIRIPPPGPVVVHAGDRPDLSQSGHAGVRASALDAGADDFVRRAAAQRLGTADR